MRRHTLWAFGLLLSMVILGACAPRRAPVAPEPPLAAAPTLYRGVNLNGADFGGTVPGTEGRDFVWPNTGEIDYFVARGMNSFRIGFRWERMQTSQKAPLVEVQMQKLDVLVKHATAKGALVVLNPQNFARYYGQLVGSATVPNDAFADFWRRLADRYKGNGRVAFGLMNEPHTMPSEQWYRAANAAIAAIRETGARNLIMVPGNAWTGAHSWTSSWYGTSNAVAMLTIHDPIENWAVEVHNYFDPNAGGGGAECVSETIGSERMKALVDWARKNGKKIWVGEIGTYDNARCAAAVRDFASYANANSDVVIGWAWWSAGPWWANTNYPLNIEPYADGRARPQMTWLQPYLPALMPVPDASAPVPPPPDRDGDDVPDSEDACPDTKGVRTSDAKTNGCPPPPPDRDGDGIPDSSDACPDEKGVASSDATKNGCPPPPPPPPELVVTTKKTQDWQSGYCIQFNLANKSSAPIAWKSITIDAKDGKVRTDGNVWGASPTGKMTAAPMTTTSPVKAGTSVNVGFCADRGPSRAVATFESVAY